MTRNTRKKRPEKPAHAASGGLLAKAIAYHQKGLLSPAKKIYLRILSTTPNNPSALHFLGVLLHAQGQPGLAISYVKRAIKIQPDYVDAHNNLGNVLKNEGLLVESEQAYRKAIEIKPDFAFGYNNLGIILKKLGRFDESVEAFRRAIALVPDYAEAYYNLGNTLTKKNEMDAALTAFDESVKACRRAIALVPNYAEAYYNLGNALIKMNEMGAALTAFRTAIILKPTDPMFYESLGSSLYAAGRADEAVVVYEEWLKQNPDNPVAKHMLIACTGENVPERASDDYVRNTFDRFSDDFDDDLKNLNYRAPLLVFEAMQDTLRDSRGALDILDAGCGTGLCAAHFKPYAKRLEGVDLSPGMLAKARGLDLYDDLIAAELTAYLLRNPETYDLIISADTLCYFGALDKVFMATALALRSGGGLVFTVEHLQSGDATGGYRINVNGRYSHTQDYVTETVCLAGFRMIPMNEGILRNESGQPVAGLIVVAGKTSAAPAKTDPGK